ncbi:LRC71 protein, partial [Odontophorus gujanensis]|nr:LRC71 protein [Odontophorus gujanensis]
MLPALGTMLARCPQLWSLKLEGNPLLKHSFHVLMGTSSNFNRISDVGAGHIAEGLRWNRSLLSLSLAHNHIGDAGALKLAEVLQPFVLTHTEVVERRRLLMEAQGQLRAAESSSGHALSPQGSVAADKLSPAKQSKGTAKKKVRSSSHSAPPAVTATPDPRPNRSRGVKGVIKEKQITEALDPPEPTHPLLEPGWHRDGNVILPGNRVLLNLNLSGECGPGGGTGCSMAPSPRSCPPPTDNHITERGLGALLAALERQQQEGAGGGLGLMRLSLKRNSFPSACEAFTRLQELLQQRDTLPKPWGKKEEQGLSP